MLTDTDIEGAAIITDYPKKKAILMETFTKCQKRGTEANSFAAAHTDVLTGQQPFLTEDAILQQPKLDC